MLELRSVSTFWNDATARARAGLGGIGQRSGIVGIILPYSLTTTSPSSCRCKPQDHAEITLHTLNMYETPILCEWRALSERRFVCHSALFEYSRRRRGERKISW